MRPVVVLTREPPRNDVLRQELEDLAQVREVPLTRTSWRARDDVARELAGFVTEEKWGTVVVTSPRSVTYVDLALSLAQVEADLGAVGATTAAALRLSRLDVGHRVLTPVEPTGAELARVLERGPVVILGAEQSRPELARVLDERGLSSLTIPCYRTVSQVLSRRQRRDLHAADVVVIAAPSAWRAAAAEIRHDTMIVAMGDTTADEVRATHDRVVVARGTDLARSVREVLDDLAASSSSDGAQ